MDNNKIKILSKIQENIKSKKPISLWIVSVMRLGMMILCILLLVFSIILVGVFIYDIFEKISIEQFFEQNIYNSSHYLFEYILFVIILIITFVFFYRKFDWPLVKEKNKIFAIGLVLVITFGFGIAKLAEKVFFVRYGLQSVKEVYTNNVPIRKYQKSSTHILLQASNNVVGKILSMKEDGDNVSIEIKVRNSSETYSIKESSIVEKLRIGEKIAVHFDVDQKTILRIKVIK